MILDIFRCENGLISIPHVTFLSLFSFQSVLAAQQCFSLMFHSNSSHSIAALVALGFHSLRHLQASKEEQ